MKKAGRTLEKRSFSGLLGSERAQAIATPLFAIILSLIAASIVFLLLGRNPLSAFYSLLQGSGFAPRPVYAARRSMFTDFLTTLNALTPMVFASLAVAVAYKGGLFNIGVSGQMLVAGFVTTIVIGYSALPAGIAMPLVLLCGIVCGGAVGAFIGWLKHRFNTNEVVSSIMLNLIFMYIISFFIQTNFINAVTRQSNPVSAASRLTLVNVEGFGLRMDIPLGFILVIPTAFLIWYLLNKTRMGYELKAVGSNRKAAGYAGINVGKTMILAMAVSGALAGLAGVTFYLGFFNSIQPRVLSAVGFDAIAVSLLGNAHPIGILFSSLLITIISRGSVYMSSMMNVPAEVAQVITGLLLLFSACGAYFRQRYPFAQEIVLREKRPPKAKKSKEEEGGETE